jgi:hypothetical protein
LDCEPMVGWLVTCSAHAIAIPGARESE